MLIAMSVGVAIGLAVRASYGYDADKLYYAVEWVALPGKSFVDLMKCFDLPLISLNIIVGVQGVFKLENAGAVGLRTFALYLFTAICAAIEGITFFLLFKPWMFQLQPNQALDPSFISLRCLNGMYFQEGNETGSPLSCSGTAGNPEFFQANIFGDSLPTIPGIPHSSSDIFKNLVQRFSPDNFVGAYAEPNVLAVMFLSVAFGLAIAHVNPHGGHGGGHGAAPAAVGTSRVLVDVVVQLREVGGLICFSLLPAALSSEYPPF